MFVESNSLIAVKDYFTKKLSPLFSQREIRAITKSIISKRLEKDTGDYLVMTNQKFSESDLLFFKNCINRMLNGEPFQYVIGETFFYNAYFDVDKRALIPRPETEELVAWIINDYKTIQNGNFIDIGSGSGCIGISISKALKNWKSYALDIENNALALTRQNATKNNCELVLIKDDINSYNSSLYPDKFLVIVSNPPYIPNGEIQSISKHVTDYEPHSALFVTDEDPLIFYRNIAEFAQKKLALEGSLYLEINPDFEHEIEQILRKNDLKQITKKEDLQGKLRMLKASF